MSKIQIQVQKESGASLLSSTPYSVVHRENAFL